MTSAEYKSFAIRSAERYYKYLDETGKGMERISVIFIQMNGNAVTFSLSKSPYNDSTEYLVFRIKGKDYSFSSDDYDSKKKRLTVIVEPTVFSILKECTPDDVILISDLKYLVTRVRDWYRAYGDTISLPPKPCNPPVSDTISNLSPSEDQLRAIKGILSSSFSYVWGAPGTGKTRVVLSACILSYLETQQKVLLVAPTNNALEQMLFGVIPVIRATGRPLSCILRLGTPSVSFRQKYPLCCENVEGKERGEELREKIEKLTECLNIAKKLALFVEKKEAVSTCLASVIDFYISIPSREEKIKKKQKELSGYNESIESLTAFIQMEQFRLSSFSSRTKGILFRSERKRQLEAVSNAVQNRDILQEHRRHCKSDIKSMVDKLREDKETYRYIYKECREAMRDYPAVFPSILDSVQNKTINEFLSASEKLIKSISEELKNHKIPLIHEDTIEKEIEWYHAQYESLKSVEEDRSYKIEVFAMTMDRLISSYPPLKVRSLGISHIFMDEAAYCSFIKGATLLGYNCPITLLGDHMQLPPVYEMDKRAMSFPDNRCTFLWSQSSIYMDSLFDSSGEELYQTFLQGSFPVFHYIRLYSLNLTYRFGEELTRVLARYVYSDKFHSASLCGTELFVIPCPYRSGSKKRTNEAEAYAIKKYIKENLSDSDSYAVLTPYVNQTSLLYEVIPELKSKERVFTVHASQGREWDTVLFSAVDTSARFLVDTRAATGLKVVNTVISRTRKRLVLFCDTEYWTEHRDGQIISALVEAAENNKNRDFS